MYRESDSLGVPKVRSRRLSPPLVIGLTGGAGSGKSSVASVFRRKGARVVDADRIGHRLLRRGSPCYSKIVKYFGMGVVARGGEIDREKLGDLVFADVRQRKRLNRIVHPELVRAIKAQIDKLIKVKKSPVVVDAALLADWGLHRLMDRVVVVKAPKGIRLKRLIAKGVAQKKAKGMLASQRPERELERLADLVIDNSGTRRQLRMGASAVWMGLGLKVEKRRRM